MAIIIGSARHDENGKYIGGKAGDQAQTTKDDYKGECSLQPFYVHKYGWMVCIRLNVEERLKLAERMLALCNNPNIGYDQGGRAGIIKAGIDTKKPTECDCSSGVRRCIIEATGRDPGNFTTATEVTALMKMGGWDIVEYHPGMKLLAGMILVSKKKGHTVIIVEGEPEEIAAVSYYPKYTYKGTSIVSALQTVGEKDTSYAHRKKIAIANGIKDYTGSIPQNLHLVDLIKQGKLIKA